MQSHETRMCSTPLAETPFIVTSIWQDDNDSSMEETVANQTNAWKALYSNGWVVGTLVAFVMVIVFFAYFQDVYHPMDELLLVGIPIGVGLGALVGLAVESRSLSRRRRNTIGLSILTGFALYVVVLILYMGSRV